MITFGGGNGVLAVDQCAQFGLDTPSLSAACVERLRPLLISVATAANPVDLTPTTASRPESLALLPQALDAVAAEPGIDTVLVIAGSMAARGAEIATVMEGFASRARKPVCVSWPSPPLGIPERLAAAGVYSFLDPVRGVQAIARLAAQGEAAARRPPRPQEAGAGRPPFDWGAHVPDRPGRLVVPEDRCHRILAAAGLPVAAARLAQDTAAAVAAAEALGFPVVLKGISPSVTHRAAAGLLAVDLRTGPDVAAAHQRLEARAREIGVTLDGVYVQTLHRGGTELLLAAFRDPMFGVMVSCGSGGGLTELIDDVVTERAPVDRQMAASMLDRLRIRRFARDDRGPLPAEPVAAFLARFSELALTAPWRRFVFEVNPVKWTRDAVVAVDGLLIIEEADRVARRGEPGRRSRRIAVAGPGDRRRVDASSPTIAREEPMRGRIDDTPDAAKRGTAPPEGRRSGAHRLDHGTAGAGPDLLPAVRLRPAGFHLDPGGGGQHHGDRARADARRAPGDRQCLVRPRSAGSKPSFRTGATCCPAS